MDIGTCSLSIYRITWNSSLTNELFPTVKAKPVSCPSLRRKNVGSRPKLHTQERKNKQSVDCDGISHQFFFMEKNETY